jgi:DNA-binding response OmpR family regulator
MTRESLLLVEDDRALSGLLVQLLTGAGYDVDAVLDAQAGLHHALTREYGAFVFDRGLPVMDGVELLRRLRARGVATPTLILTARGALADRIEGLDAGAEDYLVKPFEVEELLARLRALTRRHLDRATVIALGSRHLDLDGRRVTGDPGAAPIELSEREFELVRVLASRPSRVFTRDELLDAVFAAADSPGAVDTYVHYVRRKLGKSAIQTVHGRGYRWGSA